MPAANTQLGDTPADRHAPSRRPGSCRCTWRGLRAPGPDDNVGLDHPRHANRQAAGLLLGRGRSVARLVARALADADVVFFDGTFWSSDELIAAGLGTRRAEDMAHWPVGGPEGSAAVSARLRGPEAS